MRPSGAWCAAVVAWLVACGARPAGVPASPRDVPGPWRELTSEHFVVWTDATPDHDRTLIQTMETLRQVVLGVSFFKQEVRGRSFVVAFHDLDEVHQLVPPQFIAHAWSGRNVLRQPVIVLVASSLDDDRRIVTHELTHVISFNVITNQPSWFAEGLAGYFETVRLDEHRAMVDVGKPLEGRFRQLVEDGLTPTADLFACRQPACMDDRFYATTWALVTFLLEEHPRELAQYMQRLIDAPMLDATQLFTSSFPSLPLAALDHELARWVHYGKIRVLHYHVALRRWGFTERALTEADALAAKGALRFLFAPHGGVPPEIAQALARDPTSVIANLIAAVVHKSIAPEVAHAVASAHPADWRAWWLVWGAARTADEAREARARTCGLLAQHPTAVSIEACTRPVARAPGEDPRRRVFAAATPQINACLREGKPAKGAPFTIEIDISETGAVTAARVAVGSPAANTCIERVLEKLTFPAHHGGTFRLGTSRAPHHRGP